MNDSASSGADGDGSSSGADGAGPSSGADAASPPSSADGDLSSLSARAALAAIRAGRISAETYSRALLDRCDAERALNAFSWQSPEHVLAQARAVDAARAAGAPLGPLAGLPVIVKDNIATPGYPTSAGNAWLRSDSPAQPAPVWQALADAGAVLFGKANMHELAAGGTSNNPVFGRVGNPAAPGRIPGGSSGGTATAIAAGLAPAGLGTDTSGSLRAPASFCGIVALRPSTGPARAYGNEGIVPFVAALDTAGPMARDVDDLVLLHEAISGRRVGAAPEVSRLRIGVPRRYFWDGLDPTVEALCGEALGKLQEAGATLIDVDIGRLAEDAVEWQRTISAQRRRRELTAWLQARRPAIDVAAFIDAISSADVRALYEATPPESDDAAMATRLAALARRYLDVMDGAATSGLALDAVAYPQGPVLAPRLADADSDAAGIGTVVVRNARFAAGLGIPALVVPAGRTNDGVPVGLEFAGRQGEDEALLALGRCFERIAGT